MSTDEVGRRLVHVAGSVFPLAYLVDLHLLVGEQALTWPRLRIVYLLGSALAIALEALRLGVGVDWWIFRRLTREYEDNHLAGYALYTFGGSITVLAYEPRVAIPALLVLAIVDPVSGVLSRSEYRETKRPYVLALSFGLAGVIALAFVPLPAAVLGGGAVVVADGIKPTVRGFVLDDNLSIPITVALAIWLGLHLPGGG